MVSENTLKSNALSPMKGGIFRALEVDVGGVDDDAGSVKELDKSFNLPDNLSSNVSAINAVAEPQKPDKSKVDQARIEQYCRPQYLNVCDKDDLGFTYNLVGLFGKPDEAV